MLGIPVIRSRHISAPISTHFLSYFLYMKLADRVISSGEIIKEKMVAINGYDPQRIISIPTGVHEAWFSSKGGGEEIRQEFNIGKNDFLVGIVAMLRSWKGHGVLLEAIKALQGKIPHLKLLIIGDGPQEKTIRDTIISHGLEKKVIMAGYRKDIPQILKSLDLFVLPSYSNEGAPQAILQAMAFGIPVLSTRAGGIEEVVTNGQTGTLVPPKDIQTLSRAIDWIFRNREESLKMAHNARESIWSRFTMKAMTDKTETIYREVLEKYGHKKTEILPIPISPPLHKLSARPALAYLFKMRHLLTDLWDSIGLNHSHSVSKIKPGKL
jgi:glycosyltransferase involved in cell wall biosynthesis